MRLTIYCSELWSHTDGPSSVTPQLVISTSVPQFLHQWKRDSNNLDLGVTVQIR